MTKSETPKTMFCESCKQDIASEYFARHSLVHEVASKMSEKELLAQTVLTLSEIKGKLTKLIEYEQYKALRR